MLDHGYPKDWSTLKKLIWQWQAAGGGSLPWAEFTGNPLQFNAPKAHTLRSVKVEFSPIQDLHGYANPWPPGGGKNKLPPNATDGTYTDSGITITAKNGVYTISGTASSTVEWTFPLTQSVDLSPSTNKICFLNTVASGNISVNFVREGEVIHYWGMNTVNRVGSGWSDTGNEVIDSIIIRVYSGASLPNAMTISPVLMDKTATDVTAFYPYENLCPITGRTGADIYDTGTNVWDEEWESGAWKVTDGTKLTNASYLRNKNAISVAPATTYYLYINNGSTDNVVLYYDESGTYLSYTAGLQNGGTFTTPQNARYCNFYSKATTFANDISINYPSTDTSYHAYNPASWKVSVSWTDEAGTVYGGYLINYEDGSCDLVGTMTEADLGTLEWTYNNTDPNNSYFRTESLTRMKLTGDVNGNCSQYKWLGTSITSNMKNGEIAKTVNPIYAIFVKDSRYSDATTFTTAMSGVQLVYELATPITYHLPSLEEAIRCFPGINVVWSDMNENVEVEAKATAVT